MPSKPVLTEEDKTKIKKQLLNLCEHYWITQGYKKTSIKALCTSANISIGTFYSLFSNKEEIFFETARTVQTRLTDQFLQTVSSGADRFSLAKALKELVREFVSKPFLYDVNTVDFRAFITKLPPQDMEKIKFESITIFKEVCRITKLQPKIDDATAFGALSALLSTISGKHTIDPVCDYFCVFDFMVDKLIIELFV